MSLLDRILDPTRPPAIVAELSGNHNQNFDTATRIIQAAADAGAHGVKLQTYTADSITLDSTRPEFIVKGGLWDGQKLYELYQRASTPYEWHAPLAEFAKNNGIELFSTPFDETAVDFLEQTIAPPLYKISSFELTHIPLLEHVARTGKPIVLSTGMANKDEIEEAVSTLRNQGSGEVILLKCVSAYPSQANDFNLRSMVALKERFNSPVGLSDHSLSNEIAIASVALGARLIEKHLTDDRSAAGVDAGFSLEPNEFAELVRHTAHAHAALGSAEIGASPQDQSQRHFRRSIYASADIQAGQAFDANNVRIVRPSTGLNPKLWPQLLGKISKRDIKKGEPLTNEDL